MTPPPDELRKTFRDAAERAAIALTKGRASFATSTFKAIVKSNGDTIMSEFVALAEEFEQLRDENLALQRNWVPERYQSREARGLPEITEVG